MRTINKNQLQQLRKQYPIGCVVKLISMDDSFAPRIGTLGKVIYVDDTGTIHVKWTNGSTLGVIFGVDKIERIE
ncbi:MAG: DUF4314 domain-containing protein [Sphaerochaetaceae bacterium]|nr:DUF4314 domain-containing protein [Sphaerochaetaceae bacterium]